MKPVNEPKFKMDLGSISNPIKIFFHSLTKKYKTQKQVLSENTAPNGDTTTSKANHNNTEKRGEDYHLL
jgi:hypothetical protein